MNEPLSSKNQLDLSGLEPLIAADKLNAIADKFAALRAELDNERSAMRNVQECAESYRRELACVTAERDRAQQTCEQMGEQLTVAHATKLGPIQHYVNGILQDRKRLRALLESIRSYMYPGNVMPVPEQAKYIVQWIDEALRPADETEKAQK